MTACTDCLNLPGLLPAPRNVTFLGGTAELSEDVRLVTSDVLPLQRKAMRGILTSAGIRVVANKKKFIIEAKVGDMADLDVSDVPEAARDEYYELEVRDNRVYIRTATQAGALWGTQTLGCIYRANALGHEIPNVLIRDWPDMPSRGIFVESKWGPDRMALSDWYLVIDRLSALKMNCLGVGIYGCWGKCRFEGKPTEFLMVPVPDHPELQTEKTLRWYSPDEKEWMDEPYLPAVFEEDFYGDIVAYGKEKGVTIIPFVNSLGHNTMIPRQMPEISAKDGDDNPVGVGYCLSEPKTREFLEAFYGSIVERYYPDDIPYFHVELDEVWPDFADPEDPGKSADPWCQCPDCRKTSDEERLQDYIVWLVGMLTQKGVGKVVVWNDQLTRHMDALNSALPAKLEAAGLADRLILHWWCYSNDTVNDKTRVALGNELGVDGWVAPMTCYFNWERYSTRLRNIELMMAMAHDENATGAVAYSVHDPAWADHEALLASYAWNYDAVASCEEQLQHWALGRFGQNTAAFQDALGALQKAAADYPALGHCYHYRYTYCKADAPFPRPFPGEALAVLAALPAADAATQLAEAAALADTAAAAFVALEQEEDVTGDDRDCVRSLLGEAARTSALAASFSFLVTLYDAAGASAIPAEAAADCAAAREKLLQAMTTLEGNKPDWVVPASLQSLSVLLEFLDQLQEELKAVQAGSLQADAIRWQLP